MKAKLIDILEQATTILIETTIFIEIVVKLYVDPAPAVSCPKHQ